MKLITREINEITNLKTFLTSSDKLMCMSFLWLTCIPAANQRERAS